MCFVFSFMDKHAHFGFFCPKEPEPCCNVHLKRRGFLLATTHKVETYVFHMFRHYGFSWKRESVDYFLLQSNSKYITWWSMALSLLIVTSGYLRLLFLKSLFVSNTGTEGEKPRC
ncbi:transmembrane emp24 domain-containing protein 6 isoform X1 [Oreochromis niloticus]|uniref:transmembrane emp24 domain-containing protein 6 isoform X1 n=1 Tax=Oreochromis niloticus TaxID=8128 RepID=UPI0003946996|nr:transmembrane emp24 domain-containing protein 6 isoform X1 [Oreochromis niloticus]